MFPPWVRWGTVHEREPAASPAPAPPRRRPPSGMTRLCYTCPRHTWCENNASQSGLYIVFTWEVCFSFSFSAGWERSAVLYKVWDTNYVVIIRQHARQTCPTLRPSMIIWDLEIFLSRQTESECPLSSSKYNISNHYEAGGQVSEVQLNVQSTEIEKKKKEHKKLILIC